jgi:hypothetical protein
VGALLGTVIGVALGLVVEDAQTSTAVAAPGRARGAALAASLPSSQPPASRVAGSGNRTNGTSPPAISAPSRQTDPTSGMAKQTRIGQAAGTSPAATVRTNLAGAKTSSPRDGSLFAAVLAGRKRGGTTRPGVLELVCLQLGHGGVLL